MVLYRCVYSQNTWAGYSWLFEHVSMACNVSMGDHFTMQSQWYDSAHRRVTIWGNGNNCNSLEWSEWVASKIALIIGGLMEYFYHIWAGSSTCRLPLLDRAQKRIVNLTGDELGSSLQPHSHRRSFATFSLFYRYCHGKCSTCLSNLVPPVWVFERETFKRFRLFSTHTPSSSCT